MDGEFLHTQVLGWWEGQQFNTARQLLSVPSPPGPWLEGESRELVINGGLSSGSVAGTLEGQQPGASWGANGFQEQFGKESCKQSKQNITSPGPLCPEG